MSGARSLRRAFVALSVVTAALVAAVPLAPVAAHAAGVSATSAACRGKLSAGFRGPVAEPALEEISGIHVGVVNPSLFWVHNDSGDTARVFAVSSSGVTRREYTLAGAFAEDWEDIAVGRGPVAGTPYLYVGDIGDNDEDRAEIAVYRVPEPVVVAGPATTLGGAVALRFHYPDGSHDAEALVVDPATGDLVIITKNHSGGPAGIYRAPGTVTGGSVTTLQKVGVLSLPSGLLNGVTAADISASGSQIAVRTYASVLLWHRASGASLWSALGSAPCVGPVPHEGQGEAIGFRSDGRSYVTVSEGPNPTLHNYTSAGVGLVLDAFGGLHGYATESSAPAASIRGAPSWPGWKIARGVAVASGVSWWGVEVDAYGGLHPFGLGHAKPKLTISGAGYWPGWDIARGVSLMPNGGGGVVLDGYGGLHPFGVNGGTAPQISGGPYWPGRDLATGVAILPSGTGGYVLDGFGGLHPFGINGHAAPPVLQGGPYTPGWSLFRGITVLRGDTSGYIVDLSGGVYPVARPGMSNPPPMVRKPAWPGKDLARGIASL